MTKVILLHGNGGGTGEDNWFPWLKAELQNLGVECVAPDLPDPVEAKSSVWLPYIENELKPDEETILIGHSSGAVASMRYSETHELLGSVLVGTYYTDLGYDDEKASGYFDSSWNWQAIKNNQQWIMIFNSTDDPYIGIDEPRLIAKETGADYHEFTDRGHFGEDVNTKEFPELLAALKVKLSLS